MARTLALPIVVAALAAPALTATPRPAKEHFSDLERAQVVSFWSEPGRYEARPAGELKGTGVWACRYTAAGSVWIRELYRLRSEGKIVPTSAPVAQTEQQKRWDEWVESRAQYDKWLAEKETALKNGAKFERSAPKEPGAAPDDLAAVLPPPPPFYATVAPISHTIVFEDDRVVYEDNVTVPHKYAYYRFENGVRSGGIKIADRAAPYVLRLLDRAQINESERRVFAAVSLLEGGFDSVNTYDTGFVSVGFIQFASLQRGAGSLGAVLLRMKTDAPQEFEGHFRRFGIDVTEDGVLVAVDPTLGIEFSGPDANQRIINDKRLIAVFQRAGRLSEAFNTAQLVTAKQLYHPAEDVVSIDFDGVTMTAKVKDIFKSEAGLATLMDRKVNTGNLQPLNEYLYDLVKQTGIKDLKEAAKWEWALVRAMVWRENYLDLATLSQPVRTDINLSRGNNPRDRRGGGGQP